MATASEFDEIIRSHPIRDRLAPFRRQFESIRLGLGLPSSSNVVQTVFSTVATADLKPLVIDFMLALQSEPAARKIPSRIANRSVFGDLADLSSRVDAGQLDITAAIPLVELIVKNADEPTWNDSDFWNAVFELIARTSRATPPTAPKISEPEAPFRSASQSGFKQTHSDVDQRIREELTGRVFRDVEGFYERYFEGKAWTQQAKNTYDKSKIHYAGNCWEGWPKLSSEDFFYEWFMKIQDTFPSGLGRRYYTSANKVLTGSEANRKLDIFLAVADDAVLDKKHDWSDVLVIGELKQNPGADRSTTTLVQLAGYAREVFGSQPDRRFVPGFTICGSVMRLWVFDRSGSYSSKCFDFNEQPERFIQVIAGYALMTNAELGLNTFIGRDDNGKYIFAREMKIYLEDKAFIYQRAIACRGTACYRGKNAGSERSEYVVKFSWPSEKRDREGDMLKLAKDRGVKGIVERIHHEQISIGGHLDTIRHLRRGMEFVGAPQRMLTSKASSVNSGTGSSKGSLMGSLMDSGIKVSSTGQKRKGVKSVDDNRATKRSKLGDSRTDVEVATDAKKAEPDATGLQEPKPKYEDRIHCCLVVSPAGRPLNTYKSTKELLGALRDAVIGHRSLFENGKILHRDVSENNIIITEAASKEEPIGRLIDLDMAKKLDSEPSGASHRTGTMLFMAIGVLIGEVHTYRHDLESFFYVFIWMCICYGHDEMDDGQVTRKKSRHLERSALQDWYTGGYWRVADRKVGHMDLKVFERSIIREFPPRFDNLKELARELRDILFQGSGHRGLFTETPSDHNVMYDGMIGAFNKAIASVEKEDQD